MSESRIISIDQYLTIKSNCSNIMNLVCEQEWKNIIRLQHKPKFQVARIAVGTMGSVPKCLTNYLQMIGLSEKKSKRF